MQVFFGRESNIKQLNSFFSEEGSALVFVKGRRRVGKSTLIKNFFLDKPCVFKFTGYEEEAGRTTRRRFAKAWDQFTGERKLGTIRAVDLDWVLIFEQVYSHIERSNAKTTIILDEIQWLHSKGNGFIGHIKDFWERLKDYREIKIVLSGSSTRFFNDHIIGQNATLRGLSTQSAIHVLPFTPDEVHRFYFPEWSVQEIALVYMMTGGVPYYLERIPYKREKNFIRSINDGIFCSTTIFLEEADNIIKIELLRKTAAERIKALLRHLGIQGKSVRVLSKVTGEDEDYVYKTLIMLKEVGMIRTRLCPSGGDKKRDEFIYFLDDHYLNFYFSTLEPNSFKIKKNVDGLIFRDIIHSHEGYYIPGFTGSAFELLTFNFLEHGQESQDYGKSTLFKKLRIHNVNYTVETLLVHQESQIDLLVTSDQDREVRVIEVKWLSSPKNLQALYIDQVKGKVLPKRLQAKYTRSDYLLISLEVPERFRQIAKERGVQVLSLQDFWPT